MKDRPIHNWLYCNADALDHVSTNISYFSDMPLLVLQRFISTGISILWCDILQVGMPYVEE